MGRGGCGEMVHPNFLCLTVRRERSRSTFFRSENGTNDRSWTSFWKQSASNNESNRIKCNRIKCNRIKCNLIKSKNKQKNKQKPKNERKNESNNESKLESKKESKHESENQIKVHS